MKKLGFGLMRLPLTDPNDQKSIDMDVARQMVDTFLERGFTYFDTAWMYHGHESENAVRSLLAERYPRDAYTLATKLNAGFIKCAEDRDRIFEEQRRKTGVEYFDYYLLHALSKDYYEIYKKYDCFAWLREKKRAGLVRRIGFSFHDSAELLDRVLTEEPGLDFVQLQVNYLDWDSRAIESRRCCEVAKKHGLPIIVMEPVKGGTLASLPSPVERLLKAHAPASSVASWAVRFAAGVDNVMMVLSGMSSMEQLLDNLGFMEDFKPLDEAEQAVLARAVALLKGGDAVPCTGCGYCVDGCPMNIAIPKYFSLYNADLQELGNKDWTPQEVYYENLLADHGAAGACIGCGQCEGVCPQHLPVIKHLGRVAEHFGQ